MRKTVRFLSLLFALTLLFASLTLAAQAAALAKVTGVTVVKTDDDEIDLKWKKVSGATGYQIQVRTANGSWRTAEVANRNKTSEDVDDLRSATTYYVRVRAYKRSGASVKYGAYSNAVKTSTDPDEVSRVTAGKVKNGKVTLSWTKSARADGYRLSRYDSAKDKWVKVKHVTGTKCTVNVSSTTKYSIRPYVKLDGKLYLGDRESVTVKVASSNSQTSIITASKAKSIAIKDSGVKSSSVRYYECELDYEDDYGVRVYEIEFVSGRYEYEYTISAVSGKILEKEKERI